jgi:AcrR family transcriptional regulator
MFTDETNTLEGGTAHRIARAALHLFVEKGITATTVREITAAVGITEGAMYRHYVSKEELAWALFSDSYVAFARELERVRRDQPTLRAELAAMIRSFCTFFDRDPELFTYLLLVQHSELKKVTPSMANPVEVVRRCIAEGMERGEIPQRDSNLAAAFALGIVLQVAVFKVYGRVTESLSSQADAMVEACWRALNG